MMLVVVYCWLLMCQASSVRPDGITLPITSIVYKSSPAEQKPLSISFTPNVCNETPTTHTPPPRSIEPVNLPQESCITQEPQPPFNTVSISAPLNPAIDKPLQIQSFIPNSITPITPTCPQMDLSYVESGNFVNNNGINDCTPEPVLPMVQYKPSYVITSTDNCNNKMKIPLLPVKLDELPSNIHKVKFADSKPIFIDCSKPSKTYQIPSTIASVNPVTFSNPNNNIIQQLRNQATTEAKTNNVEISASSGKVVYPISDVIFNYGTNSFNQYQTANAQKPQPCSIISPIFTTVDYKVGLETQNNRKSPDIINYYCNNINLLPKPEPVCYCTGSPTSASTLYLTNQAHPISQLPYVNTINKPFTQASTLPCALPTCANGFDTTSDTFTSQLSCSLNSIISLLTSGLLSTVFGNTSPELIPEIACESINLQEPVIDIPTSFINTDAFVSNTLFASCPPPLIDIPVISPNPETDFALQDFDSRCLTIPPVACKQNAPKGKPYLASITINIMPSPDTTNDIIIVV